MHNIRLSLLDFLTANDTDYGLGLTDAIEQAQLAEQLGFERFWLAEHHTWCGTGSPEILLPLIAASTTKIRVGLAGVLLNFYSPYKVAETFQVLEELFPRRIDLGVCRGMAEPWKTEALMDGRENGNSFQKFEEKTTSLLHYIQNGLNPNASVKGFKSPEPWLLGTGTASMRLAAKLSVAYCHSLFHKGALLDPSILKEYCDTVKVDYQGRQEPNIALGIAGICAESMREAERLTDAHRHKNSFVIPTVVGTPPECADRIFELARTYEVDQVVWLDLSAERYEQSASIRLLGHQMNLAGNVVSIN
jgi:luciferase family oxidoreductase group 1